MARNQRLRAVSPKERKSCCSQDESKEQQLPLSMVTLFFAEVTGSGVPLVVDPAIVSEFVSPHDILPFDTTISTSTSIAYDREKENGRLPGLSRV